jgi:outer membrane immunogenic protein
LLLLSFATHAADIPVKAPAKALAVAVFDWTGFYLGVDGGYLAGRGELFLPVADLTAYPRPDGFLAGAHIGARRQFSSGLVLGIEADAWNAFDADTRADYTTSTNDAKLDLNWGASVRAQLGLATGRFLVHVTGGASYIDFDGCTTAGANPSVCVAGATVGDGRWGWTAGAGVAYAFGDNISARLEYLYADYGEKTYTTPGIIIGGLTRVDLRTHTVRAGVSWKFATGKAPTPVVTKY